LVRRQQEIQESRQRAPWCFALKISTTTVFGLLFGVAIGLFDLGRITVPAISQYLGMIQGYVWWIVVLCMWVPLADYLSGMRTTVTGVVTGYPFRHLAGFFTGLAVGLGLLLLLAPRLF
jgi:hypothetical protein